MPVSVKEVVFDSAVSDIQVQGWCSFAGGGGVAGEIVKTRYQWKHIGYPESNVSNTVCPDGYDHLQGIQVAENQLCFFYRCVSQSFFSFALV